MEQVRVQPAAGGWRIGDDMNRVYDSQDRAIEEARRMLEDAGGGELVVTDETGEPYKKDVIGDVEPRDLPG